MITFTSKDDLAKLSPDDPAFPIVEDLVKRLIIDYIIEGYNYNPDGDRWIRCHHVAFFLGESS